MPAQSKKQLVAARIAKAAKEGKIPQSKLKGASKAMAKGMTKKQLGHYTKTPAKGLPEKKGKGNEKISEALTVDQDIEVMLDGEIFLLEAGDKIQIIN